MFSLSKTEQAATYSVLSVVPKAFRIKRVGLNRSDSYDIFINIYGDCKYNSSDGETLRGDESRSNAYQIGNNKRKGNERGRLSPFLLSYLIGCRIDSVANAPDAKRAIFEE